MSRLKKVANIDSLIKEVQNIGVSKLLDCIRSSSSDSVVKNEALEDAMQIAKTDNFDDDQIEELEDYFFSTPLVQIVINKPSNQIEEIARDTTYSAIMQTVGTSGQEQIKNDTLNELKGDYTEEELQRLNNIEFISVILGVAINII